RLIGKAGLPNAGPNQAVELGQARPGPAMLERATVDAQQRVEELVVARVERARADVLRVVAPVAVGADPNLEQRGLVLLDGPVSGRRERPDAWARPDERKAERQLHLPLPPCALAVDEALPERRRLALRHPRRQLARHVPHRRCRGPA